MLILPVIFVFVAIIALVNILALVEGRSGSTYAEKAMVASGTIGLLSLLVMIGSAYLISAMLIAASFDSPPGYAFKVSAPTCGIATLVSLVLYMMYRRWGARST